jgi:hypothetical protein
MPWHTSVVPGGPPAQSMMIDVAVATVGMRDIAPAYRYTQARPERAIRFGRWLAVLRTAESMDKETE